MKRTFTKMCLWLALVIAANTAFSQSIERYLYDQGTFHLSQMAHASNDFMSGTYDIHPGYLDVSIKSKDNVFGVTERTNLRIKRGGGGLYFEDIIVQSDEDYVDAFKAFGFQVSLMTALIAAVDKETYNKMRNAVKDAFHTDFEHWTGKMWAILALNLDYYEYVLTGK